MYLTKTVGRLRDIASGHGLVDMCWKACGPLGTPLSETGKAEN